MAQEQQLQKKLTKFLDDLGIYNFKIVHANRAGIPDVVACILGQFAAFEIKSSVGKLTGLQKKNLQQIYDQKGIPIVVSPQNFDETKKQIAEFLERRKIYLQRTGEKTVVSKIVYPIIKGINL